MKRLNECNWLIDCVISKYSLSTEYKLLLLSEEEYYNFQVGHRAFLQLNQFFVENLDFLREIVDYPQRIIDSYSKQHEKQIQDHEYEYDGLLTLNELRYTDGSCIQLDKLDNTDFFITLPIIKDIYPVCYDILVMNEEVNFIIALPEDKFEKKEPSEKMRIITHEALHIVEKLQNDNCSFNEIDNKIGDIITECSRRE